jgi:hypothetical protein
MEMEKETKKVGILLIVGIYLMPYVFIFKLFGDNYSTKSRLFASAYLCAFIGLMAYAVSHTDTAPSVAAHPASSPAQSNLPSYSDSSSVGSNPQPKSSQAQDGEIYKYFSGKWFCGNCSQKDDLYLSFSSDGIDSGSKDHKVAGAILGATIKADAATKCDSSLNTYGTIGDANQKIGTNLISQYPWDHYYTRTCLDDKPTGAIFILSGTDQIDWYQCQESSCNDHDTFHRDAAQ